MVVLQVREETSLCRPGFLADQNSLRKWSKRWRQQFVERCETGAGLHSDELSVLVDMASGRGRFILQASVPHHFGVALLSLTGREKA